MPTLAQALQGTRTVPPVRLYVGSVSVVTATTMTVVTPSATVVARIIRTGVTPVVGNQALVIDQPGIGRFGVTLA